MKSSFGHCNIMNKNYLLSKENAYKSEQYFYNSINRMAQSIVIDTIEKTQTGTSRYRYVGDDPKTITLGDLTQESTRYTGSRATLYANGQAVATNRSASQYDNGRAYFGTDILGSVRSATDDYATLEDRYEYDIFGTPYEGDFTGGLNNGYTGKPYDSVTGLYNYGYRDYSPQQARFTTVDPIRDGNNWFSYVVNDPVNYVDLWGLCKTSSDAEQKKGFFETVNDFVATANDFIKETAQDIKEVINDVWVGMTYFHFENRDALNTNLPTYEEIITKPGNWQLLPPNKSIFHDNEIGSPEKKYVHEDGREVVYTKDNVFGGSDDGTYQIYTDPVYKGTYNYIAPTGIFSSIGHFFVDVVPYVLTGKKNERDQ